MFVVVPVSPWTGKPPPTRCLEWFLLPPAWLQYLLRYCCSPETEAITLLLLHFRLPGPTARVSAAGSEAKTRGGSATANNRRSQSFNNYDKSKPVTSPLPPPPASSHEKGKPPSWGSFLASSFIADPVLLGECGVANSDGNGSQGRAWLAGTLLAEVLIRWGQYYIFIVASRNSCVCLGGAQKTHRSNIAFAI